MADDEKKWTDKQLKEKIMRRVRNLSDELREVTQQVSLEISRAEAMREMLLKKSGKSVFWDRFKKKYLIR